MIKTASILPQTTPGPSRQPDSQSELQASTETKPDCVCYTMCTVHIDSNNIQLLIKQVEYKKFPLHHISISSSPQVSTTFQVSFLLFQADFFLLLLPTLSLLLED